MILHKISFENYRNIDSQILHFYPGVNLLYGENAQGKTNALEGIHFFASGKSFRGVKDREILKIGTQKGALDMVFADKQRENHLHIDLFCDKNKKLQKNGVKMTKTSEFLGNFHSVLFCPEHLQLIQGAPQMRRGFLDGAICQLKPSYVDAVTTYQRLLKQRNALLKSEHPTYQKPLIEVLTMQMAAANTHLMLTRYKYLKLMREPVREFLLEMTDGNEHINLSYQTMLGEQEAIINALENGEKNTLNELFYARSMAHLEKDIAAKNTLLGCHKDDIFITLNDMEAKKFASQGQDRSLALALKLAEGEMCREATGEYPVFLFDDMLSELDKKRQHFLMKRLENRQVIMTCCNEEWFENNDIHMIRVVKGKYFSEKTEEM